MVEVNLGVNWEMSAKINYGRLGKRSIVGVSLGGGLAFLILMLSTGFFPDYGALWTAARVSLTRPELLYDAQAITDLQDWMRGTGLRPWIYPPSTLLYLLPFSILPFNASLWVWSLLSVVLYSYAAFVFADQHKLIIAFVATFSFVTMFGLVYGQTAPAVAALVFLGLQHLDRNAVLAGVLFGIAATIKPQIVVLAPLALIAGRYYTALIASVVTGAAIGVLSIAVFGVSPWVEWIRALLRFLDIVREIGIFYRGASPGSLLLVLGIEGTAGQIARIVFALVGIAACWKVFRASASLPHRLAGMVGGGILTLPYANGYDLTALAPAAAYFILVEKHTVTDWTLALVSLGLLLAVGPFTSVMAMLFTFSVCYHALYSSGLN